MAYQRSKDVEKWLAGKIPDAVDKELVITWLRDDPVWHMDGCDVTFKTASGSHIALVYVQGMSGILKRWSNDVFDVNVEGGRKVLKWQIEQLCKACQCLDEMLAEGNQ